MPPSMEKLLARSRAKSMPWAGRIADAGALNGAGVWSLYLNDFRAAANDPKWNPAGYKA